MSIILTKINNFNQIFTKEGNDFAMKIDGLREVEFFDKRSVLNVLEHCQKTNERKPQFWRKKIRESSMLSLFYGRGEKVRTPGPMVPNHVRYQTALHPAEILLTYYTVLNTFLQVKINLLCSLILLLL